MKQDEENIQNALVQDGFLLTEKRSTSKAVVWGSAQRDVWFM